MSVLVVIESRGESRGQENSGPAWHRVSFEAAAAGKQLADLLSQPLRLAMLGEHVESEARELVHYPVETVYLLDHPLLREYTPEAYTIALEQHIRVCQPRYVVFPHTYQTRDFAPKLAARFGSALVSDVVGIRVVAGDVRFVRPMFLGKLQAEVCSRKAPVFVSVQASSFRALEPEAAGATMERVTIQLESAQVSSKPETPFRTMQAGTVLNAAAAIVCAGRGVKQQEDLSLVQALAAELDAEVAGSRPMCDSGWLAMDRLVGSSGQTVAPNLYVAVGISGAIQHLLGMKGAKTIVAINNDRSAPIFDHAHYGIAGDLRTVLPALLDELRKTKP